MTLKELSRIEHEAKCAKTSMPPAYVPVTKFTDLTANGLTKCIETFIRLEQGYADRVNNMGVMRDGKWTTSGTRKGIPDIFAAKHPTGRMVGIEVKIGKDRQSDDQKKRQEEIEQSGGVYIIAKTFEQFYNEWIKI